MPRQYKAKSNGHLRSWLAVLCLAHSGMLLAAQQPAATPGAVRTMLNQSAPAKPAAAPVSAPSGGSASTAPAAPKQAQNTKPLAPTSSATAPSPSAPKPATGAAQTSAPAQATSSAAAKPTTSSTPTGKPGSSTTAGSNAGAANPVVVGKPALGVAAKPVAAAAAKPVSSVPPASKLKTVSEPVTAAKADVRTSTATPAITPVAAHENIARRDPFEPLLGKDKGGDAGPMNLPAGKPGLLISSLRIDGIVNGPNGMIAIVTNPQERVYFLREGDRLYDGQVQHITMDGISFHQSGKDPFGNSVEREVAKRLNSIPGEQR